MKHCSNCGHHHGQKTDHGMRWPSCGAYAETESGGIRRCGCTKKEMGE